MLLGEDMEVILENDMDRSELEKRLRNLQGVTRLKLVGTEKQAREYARLMGSSDGADLVVVGSPVTNPYDANLRMIVQGNFFPLTSYKETKA